MFAEFKSVFKNAFKVVKLSYEIAGNLVIVYFSTVFIGAITPVVGAYILQIFIDRLITIKTQDSIPTVVFLILASYFTVEWLNSTLYKNLNVNYFDYLLRNKMQIGLNYRFSAKISSLDVGHLENPEIQNLIARVQQTYLWQIGDFLRTLGYAFSSVVSFLFNFIVLVKFGIWLPLVILLISLPRAYFRMALGNFAWSMYGSGAPQIKKLWYLEHLLSDPNSILESKVFGSRKSLLAKLEQTQSNLYELNKQPLDRYRKSVILLPLFELLVVFILVAFKFTDFQNGLISIGQLSFLVTMLVRLQSDSVESVTKLGDIYGQKLYIQNYFELMNLPKLILEKQNPIVLNVKTPPKIEFKHVSFGYRPNKLILKNIDFSIEPGETVALVGINGAGKSTLIKLLCRFYDVTGGEILINKTNLKDYEITNWYKHIATLFQHFVKYNFTVKENIMLGAPEISDQKRAQQSAEKSGAIEFINKFDNKFEQMLGRNFEDGEELSGGQWQKLAIARAFYEQAPILIMDEPTSAIDAESEQEIFENLLEVYKGKTLILVSHRFSTVRKAQKIIVLDQGEIVESGSHEELLAINGKYASMYLAQAKGYK